MDDKSQIFMDLLQEKPSLVRIILGIAAELLGVDLIIEYWNWIAGWVRENIRHLLEETLPAVVLRLRRFFTSIYEAAAPFAA